MQIQRIGVQQRTRGAHDRHFHAAAEARVETDHALLASRRRQQQLLEITTEDRNRFIIGTRFQFDPQFHLDSGREQALVRIGGHQRELLGGFSASDHLACHPRVDLFQRRFHPPYQLAFGFTAADGQHAMTGNRAQRLRIVEVILELGFVAGLAGHHAALHDTLGAGDLAHPTADQRVFRHLLRQDVARALQCRFHRRDFRRLAIDFGQQIRRGRGQYGAIIERSAPQSVGQEPKTAFTSNHGPRATLGLERQVKIFERLLGVGRKNGRLQCVIELALFVHTLQHRRAAILELVEVFGAFAHIAQLHLVETAGHLLAVPGDEWQGGTLGEEGKRALNLLRVQRKFRRDARDDGGSNRIGHVRGFYASREGNSTACVFRAGYRLFSRYGIVRTITARRPG